MSAQPNDCETNPTPSSSSSTQYSFTPAPTYAKMSTKPEPAEAPKEEEKKEDSIYECNICLDTAREAVVSMCGHLFCWPCIHQWLETRPTLQRCPVCKAAISKEKVIPLYGRNSTNQEDPRKKKAPPRPQSQREETEAAPGFQGFGFDSGFHLSFGIGAFPFGFFASSFNFNDPRQQAPTAQRGGVANLEEDQFLSKIFLWVAIVFFTWLILA